MTDVEIKDGKIIIGDLSISLSEILNRLQPYIEYSNRNFVSRSKREAILLAVYLEGFERGREEEYKLLLDKYKTIEEFIPFAEEIQNYILKLMVLSPEGSA